MRLVRRASRPVLEVRAAVAAEAATAVIKAIAGIAAGFPMRITEKLCGSLANPAGSLRAVQLPSRYDRYPANAFQGDISANNFPETPKRNEKNGKGAHEGRTPRARSEEH